MVEELKEHHILNALIIPGNLCRQYRNAAYNLRTRQRKRVVQVVCDVRDLLTVNLRSSKSFKCEERYAGPTNQPVNCFNSLKVNDIVFENWDY